MTDDDLRNWWREQGGSFHGPNVEMGMMTEEKLLVLLRDILTNYDCYNCDYKGIEKRNLANCPKCGCSVF